MSKDNSIPTLKALDRFLESFLNPAFGSLPKAEIEILVLDLLEQTGRITEIEKSTQYLLATKLRISPTKAKNLLYNWSLRKKYEEKQFKEMLEKILLNPKYKTHRDNDGWFFLQIENPLLLEYVKNRIQQLEHIPDGSFSSKIIKLQAEAFADLIEDCIGKENKNEILKKLGIPDNSFKELLVETLKESAEQYIGKSGVALTAKVLNLLKSKRK